MSPTILLLPTFRQMLEALSNWLAKAAASRSSNEVDGLLAARLAPDMFPLSTQIRFACIQALEAIARLRGEDIVPLAVVLRDEAVSPARGTDTIERAQARIAETLALVDALAEDALDGPEDRAIAHELPDGTVLDLTAETFARDWVLSQFYFHLMVAYAILRREGVPLGKVDYVAHMLTYVRPGTRLGR